jgi:hypothetical protein
MCALTHVNNARLSGLVGLIPPSKMEQDALRSESSVNAVKVSMVRSNMWLQQRNRTGRTTP